MSSSVMKSLEIIAICAVCTFISRYLPFAVFGNRPVPSLVRYLGKHLPMAVMTTLMVYFLRHMSFASAAGFVPESTAVAMVIAIHLWRHNTFLSIVGGTACYMLLVQMVF